MCYHSMHDFKWIKVPLPLHVTKTVMSYVVKATVPALVGNKLDE
jgi:hypothetical protein